MGIVIYEMLTGRVPFSADTPLAVMVKVMHDPLPTPRTFSPDIPDVLQGVILKATAKEPAQRYQTAEALIDALKRSLDVRPTLITSEIATQVSPSPSLSSPPPSQPAHRAAPASLISVEKPVETPARGSERASEAAATTPSTATAEASPPIAVNPETAKTGELLFAQTLSGTVAALAAVDSYTLAAGCGEEPKNLAKVVATCLV